MPTQRKRIGFLPRLEVQNIIDEICKHNKLSQSKVTGILVEEALRSRGVLNSSINKLSLESNCINSKYLITCNKTIKGEIPNHEDNNNSNNGSINDEVQMINDFIEFKFFKNIMNRNKSRIN